MASVDYNETDFCRVCRCEGTVNRPLFYPCMCTGSIKYIHQDCLQRWLQYSRRHTCELCNHRFKFTPIYAAGTPRFIPLKLLLLGLVSSLHRLIFNWLHICVVTLAWGMVIPLISCRIYRCLFTGGVTSLLALPLDILSTKHLLQDCVQGFTIMLFAVATILAYISLREQLMHGGLPTWLVGQDAAFGNNDADPEARPQGFPDLLNIFGAANGGDHPPVEHVPQGDAAVNVDEDVRENVDPTVNEAANQGATGDGALPVQPQEFGWRPVQDDEEFDEPRAGAGDADAMNWEHLFGFDGSLAFLEHMLWVIAFNTLFIVIAAFCPYNVGQFTVVGFKLNKIIHATHMEGLITSLIGYFIIAGLLFLSHCLFKAMGMYKVSYLSGLGYVYIKVALVSLLELGVLPVLCGFWIDACTMSMFNATVTSRMSVFHQAPIAFTFIHWAMGMLYMFYLSSLLLLGRTVVRPGLLRFLTHFNERDFRPVQDIVMQPLYIYVQHLIAVYCIWGILIVLMLWVPIESVRRLIPGFLPFQVTVAYESPLDYSVELILVQIVLPFLIDAHAKVSLRHLLRLWCVGVSWILGLRSYLLGDVPFVDGDLIVYEQGEEIPFVSTKRSTDAATTESSKPEPTTSSTIDPNSQSQPEAESDVLGNTAEPEQVGPQAAEAHQDDNAEDADAEGESVRYVPYKRPTYFGARATGLLLILVGSLMALSTIFLIVPVGLGRLVFRPLSSNTAPKHDAVALVGGLSILSIMLRLSLFAPIMIDRIRQFLVALVVRGGRLLYQTRPLFALRTWTRSAATCDLTITRTPALPPPPPPIIVSSQRTTENDAATTVSVVSWLQTSISFLFRISCLLSIGVVLLVLLPTALGLLINLVFITPFQVGAKKTLIIGFWEHWIFGFMHLKALILTTLVGPNWWFKPRLEAFRNELVQQRLNACPMHLLSAIAPLIMTVVMCLGLPYLLAHYLGQILGLDEAVAFRYVYPCVFFFALSLFSVVFQAKRFQRLYTHIKDENYLVGQRLVNFRSGRSSSIDPSSASPPQGQHAIAASSPTI